MKTIINSGATAARLLLLSAGLLMPFNVSAVNDPDKEKVTVAELDAAIAAIELISGTNGIDGIDGASPPFYMIGDHYAGGIVFWVDADGKHGLIVAEVDQNTAIEWNNGIDKATGATGDGLGAGAMNTAIQVATQIDDDEGGNFAAKVAADYRIQDDGITSCTGSVSEICYGDWYLPSKAELNLLYNKRGAVGGFSSGNYWSSTEASDHQAWYHNFGFGTKPKSAKLNALRVRAVRAF